MTCQWCTNYRRRGGSPKCLEAGSDGKPVLVDIRGKCPSDCKRFSPRVCCSTCEFRCPEDERLSISGNGGKCPKWSLRKLSPWGGYRGRR